MKVTRDKEVKNWSFTEKAQISRDFGSGYPSDPNSKRWLDTNFDPVFGYPNFVRWSWKTVENELNKRGLKYHFPGEDGEEPGKEFFQNFMSGNQKKGILARRLNMQEKFDL